MVCDVRVSLGCSREWCVNAWCVCLKMCMCVPPGGAGRVVFMQHGLFLHELNCTPLARRGGEEEEGGGAHTC